MPILLVAANTQAVLADASTSLKNVAAGSLLAWIRVDSFPSGTNDMGILMLSRGADVYNSRAAISVYSSNGYLMGAGAALDADTVQTFAESVNTISLSTWIHVAATIDYTNRVIRLYTAGVLRATSGVLGWTAGNTSNTNSDMLRIGESAVFGYINGAVDDVRVYNRKLSDAEIQTIAFCRGTDEIVYGLQHRYKLNEAA